MFFYSTFFLDKIREFVALPFANVFSLSGETKSTFVSAMHIISISFLFAGINIALQGVFQALNRGLESLSISLGRQLIFILPVAWMFAQLILKNQAAGWIIWLTFPIAEMITAMIACFLMKRVDKKMESHL